MVGYIKFRLISIALAFFIFLFLLLLPPFSDILSIAANKTIAVAGLMIVLWLTEAIPVGATSLIPIVLFPILNILKLEEVTSSYGNPIIFLFMGGFILALGMEKWNLHKRIALNIIRITGTGANGILTGFMVATALLSMWISNTATAVIMLPMALSVIQLLIPEKDGLISKDHKNFGIALTLIIAYSANIGGMATLIGTPPNIVLKGYMQSVYQQELSFTGWLAVGLPVSILLLITTYFLIVKVLYRNNIGKLQGGSELIIESLKKLGPVSNAEKLVAAIFLATAALWIFRIPVNELIGKAVFSDTNIAMIGGLLMFLLPSLQNDNSFLLEWNAMQKLPWGILLLFGGGLALANAMETTGIINSIGDQIAGFSDYSDIIIILSITCLVIFLTEVMSNVALCTVFIPVTFTLAEGFGMNPLALALPATLASSCSFMLPMGTPPNAIVFGSGHLKMKEMAKAGLVLNIVAIVIITLLADLLFKVLV